MKFLASKFNFYYFTELNVQEIIATTGLNRMLATVSTGLPNNYRVLTQDIYFYTAALVHM